jgi:hypothetical protein
MHDDYWVSPSGDGRWQVKQVGNGRASSVHDTQAEAWSEGQRLARAAKSEAFLQNREGQIRERNTYRQDRFPPRG